MPDTSDLTLSDRLRLLQSSCERLPRLVELASPPAIVVNELRLLNEHALSLLAGLLAESTRKELRRRRRDHEKH